jgi:hypothetical protein
MTADTRDVGENAQRGTINVPNIERFVQDLFKPPAPRDTRETPTAMHAAELPASASVARCPGEEGLSVEDPKVRALKENIIAETCKDVGTNGNFSAKTQEDWRKLFDIYKQAGFSQSDIENSIKNLSDTVCDKLQEEYPGSRPGVFAAERGANGFAMGIMYAGTPREGARPSFKMGEFADAGNGACPIADNPILEDPKVRERINHVVDETCKDLEQSHTLMPKTEDDWRDLYRVYKEAGLNPEQISLAFRQLEESINKQMHKDSGPYPVLLVSKLPNGLFLNYNFRREPSPVQPPQPIRIDS